MKMCIIIKSTRKVELYSALMIEVSDDQVKLIGKYQQNRTNTIFSSMLQMGQRKKAQKASAHV